MSTAEMPSSEIQMSTTDEVEFPYRAISSSAITSIAFAVLALMLGYFFWPGLGLALIGALLGFVALRKIVRFPDEFDGKQLALIGIIANLGVLAAGASMHAYIYLTEVPDGYTRVQFFELQQGDESLPDQPTEKAMDIHGDPVFLKGYIHPSSGSGLLKRFILVPDLGTCCFGGQPKSSDMIEVTLRGGQTTKAGMRKKKLAGEFLLNQPQKVTDFDNNIFYRMKVDQIK